MDITQLAHATDDCILCREGSDALFPNDFGEDLLILLFVSHSFCNAGLYWLYIFFACLHGGCNSYQLRTIGWNFGFANCVKKMLSWKMKETMHWARSHLSQHEGFKNFLYCCSVIIWTLSFENFITWIMLHCHFRYMEILSVQHWSNTCNYCLLSCFLIISVVCWIFICIL